MNDRELLQSFARQKSEAAFAELVRRHGKLVYSCARQRVGDPHAAEDITQSVFLALAIKAPTLPAGTILTGWLYRATQFAAVKYHRREHHRQEREMRASEHQQIHGIAADTAALWEQISPHLAEALDGLSATDREAVLLRFYEQANYPQIAETLRLSHDAARKRVDRALEQLRRFFTRKGVGIGTGALATVLGAHAVEAMPVAVAVQTVKAAAAVAGGTMAATETLMLAKGALKAMFIAKVKAVSLAAAACLVVAGTGVVAAKQLSVPPAVKSKPTVAPLVLTETGIELAQATAPKALPVSNAPAPVGGFILRVRKAGDAVAGPRTVRIGDGNDVLRVPDQTVYFPVKVIKILQLPAGAEVAVGDRLLVAVPAENKAWQFTGGECTVGLERRPTEDGANPLLNWVYRFPMDAPDAHTADCVAWAELDKQKLASLPAPLVGAAERAAALRQNLDQFELRVVPRLLGGAHGTVILSRQPQPAGRKGIVGETWVEIDATQAGKLIAHLESTDPFLGRAEQTSRGMGKRAWQKGYYLEASGFEANPDVIYMERLVKVPGEVSRLQALRNQLDGPAAAALDQVLQTLTATP